MTARLIPIPQYGVRPLLVAGGERTPMALTVGAGAAFLGLAWQFRSIVSLVAGILIMLVLVPTLRAIGKRDPMMFGVYLRYITYRAHYPARSTPFGRK